MPRERHRTLLCQPSIAQLGEPTMVVGGKRQRWRQPRHCCLAHRSLASRNRNGHAGAPVDLGRISTMGTLMRSSVSRYIVCLSWRDCRHAHASIGARRATPFIGADLLFRVAARCVHEQHRKFARCVFAPGRVNKSPRGRPFASGPRLPEARAPQAPFIHNGAKTVICRRDAAD
jgi:hypothetical protein